MATGIAGTWNQLASAPPMKATQAVQSDATSNANNAADGSSASISANDFLTLLVTEMKNQDPTADTDPNEYINQLVQVNSLEQLISINQTLRAGSGASAISDSVHRSGASPLNTSVNVSGPASPTASTSAIAASSPAPGSLSVPDIHSAALRVAEALAGQAKPR